MTPEERVLSAIALGIEEDGLSTRASIDSVLDQADAWAAAMELAEDDVRRICRLAMAGAL